MTLCNIRNIHNKMEQTHPCLFTRTNVPVKLTDFDVNKINARRLDADKQPCITIPRHTNKGYFISGFIYAIQRQRQLFVPRHIRSSK